MKPKEKPQRLLWIDLEMTGLEQAKDRIVEVAVIVTDFKFKELATYEAQVSHDERSIRRLLKHNPFWVKRPAEVEQMIKSMHQGKSEREVQKDLLTLVEKYFLPGESVYLAGNSIRVDRSFIDQWWPKFSARLHYRMLDVTAFKLWWIGNGAKEFKKKEKHRALEDIRESIAELKHYAKDISIK